MTENNDRQAPTKSKNEKLILLVLLFVYTSVAYANNCTIGQPCGNSCISWSYTCHIGTTSASTKSSQTISFAIAPTIVIGETGTVSATATSYLPVTYSSSTAGVCTVSGSTVTGIAAGTCTIAANQAGNANYNAATQVMQSFTIQGTASTNALAVTPMIAANYSHAVALKSDGTVLAWGGNEFGQLGDGTFGMTAKKLSPVAVVGLTGVAAVSAGDSHTVALKSDGTVWAWGSNSYGRLGDGTSTDRLSPVAVVGLTGVVAVSAGSSHTVALKSDGTVWAWGINDLGQLCDGTTTGYTHHPIPMMVPGLTGVVSVSAGSSHTVALKSDGTVVACGINAYGQLGDGTMTNRSWAVAVTGLTGVVSVSAANYHTVALKSDGTVAAWGRNSYGQLGDGTTTDRLSPVAVPGLTGVVAVAAAGSDHTVALKSDGTVVAWGYNYMGQLGDGTTTDRLSPVAVAGLTGVTAVAADSYYTVALKSDGTVVTWGNNAYGQLGDGTTTRRSSPVAVPWGLNLITSTIAAAISDARVFAYAEANYPSIFTGSATAGQYQQYSYRHYPASGNYLAVDTAGVIYLLGTYTGGVLTSVGPVESFRTPITTWEASVGLVY